MKAGVALFPLGRTVATPGALEALARTATSPSSLLDRHVSGDWGDIGPEDWAANERDLIDGERLLSVYHLEDGTKLYVITEWDRSITTALKADEY
jgi:hypothetical protein